MRSHLASLGRHRGILLALLVLPASFAASWWAFPPRPRTTWVEKPGSLIFSPDGRSILSLDGGTNPLRDTATGEVFAELTGPPIDAASANREVLDQVCFTADGRSLIGMADPGSKSRWATLKVWDAASARGRASFRDVGPLWNLDKYDRYACSCDAGTIAFGRWPRGRPATTEVWDIASLTRRASFPDALPVAISPDGGTLALRESEEGTRLVDREDATRLTVRDVTSGRVEFAREFAPASPDQPNDATFSPSGEQLVVASTTLVRLFDIASKEERFVLPESYDNYSFPSFGSGGTALFPSGHHELGFDAYGDHEPPPFIDLSAKAPRRAAPLPVCRFYAFSSNGKVAALIGPNDLGTPEGQDPGEIATRAGLRVIDVPSGRQRFALPDVPGSSVAVFSPDGDALLLFSGRDESPLLRILPDRLRRVFLRNGWGEGGTDLRLIDSANGHVRHRWPLRPFLTASPPVVAFSARGDLMALKVRSSWATDWRVEIWEIPPPAGLGPRARHPHIRDGPGVRPPFRCPPGRRREAAGMTPPRIVASPQRSSRRLGVGEPSNLDPAPAKQVLLHLATAGAGERLDEMHVERDLEVGDLAAAEIA